MPSNALRHQQLQRIAAQQNVANRLLTASNQDTIKTQVTHALRDLDEAMRVLSERAHASQSTLQSADLLIETAEWRLTTVEHTLKGC
jgi:hypothetical protein